MLETHRRGAGDKPRSRTSFTTEELRHGTSEAFLTEIDLASRWKQRPKTLRNLRSAGKGPPFHKFGSSVRYALSDVLRFEEASRQS